MIYRKRDMTYSRIGRRIAKLNRGFYCYYCSAQLVPPGTRKAERIALLTAGAKQGTVDHMTPLARGGDYADSNMVLACLDCNAAKGTMTLGEFLVWRRRSQSEAVRHD